MGGVPSRHIQRKKAGRNEGTKTRAVSSHDGSRRLAPDSEWAACSGPKAGLIVGIFLLLPWKTPDAFIVAGSRCRRTELGLAISVALFVGLGLVSGA